MSIQWYPGHMHKAKKEVIEILPLIDIVVEVIDARIPYSSSNPMLHKLTATKKQLKVLTKSDLADESKTQQWLQFFKQFENLEAISVTTKQPAQIRQLVEQCKNLCADHQQRHKTINVMILGIPNVGKSTLINTLAGKTIAKTGNEPAVTKGQQRINLKNGIMLFDTPGMLWPKVENPLSAYRLATTGAIKDTAISYVDVAYFAADFMLKHYPDRLRERYGLDTLPTTEIEFLELAGQKRGCLTSGGRVDLERISPLFLNELRSGLLGPLTLETPEQIEPEQQEVEKSKAEKTLRDEERKRQRKQKSRSRK